MFVIFTQNVRLTEVLEMVPVKELVLSTSSVSQMELALLVGFEYLWKYFQEGKYVCLKTCLFTDIYVF